ncbi:GntR family transcriptional regulator [Brachybacterium kimchii]|uniref:GntR family transcriptional regulator n=1 Tax=Brachybacterium kimchii TaxID=2942909 RepID=A0ABY4N8J0_9MICO|nr:GntR family transcriptional regulator [Brachybacterium kimchii]UQN30429.1 GntR family transcriptional regulator [Brachybacterium kimchii]
MAASARTRESREKSGAGPSGGELAALLREAITSGRMVPEQRLVEADLSQQYGASRGNVRIALSELAVEGLVERMPHRGARVRAVSVSEAIEITEVRGALESLCASKAAERVTDSQVAQLRELGTRMDDAVRQGDLAEYSAGNARLHALIIEISEQHTAAETIRRLRGQAVRFQFRLAAQPGRPSVSLPQHLAIIEAVCSRKPEAAAAAMRAHLASVAEAIADTE